MADVRVMKRGKVYQYQFEIAPVDGKILMKDEIQGLLENSQEEGIN